MVEKAAFDSTGLEVKRVAFDGIPIMRLSMGEGARVIRDVIGMGVNFIDSEAENELIPIAEELNMRFIAMKPLGRKISVSARSSVRRVSFVGCRSNPPAGFCMGRWRRRATAGNAVTALEDVPMSSIFRRSYRKISRHGISTGKQGTCRFSTRRLHAFVPHVHKGILQSLMRDRLTRVFQNLRERN